MPRTVTPVEVSTAHDGSPVHAHPSFGRVVVNTVFGSSGRMFGSPVADHPTYMRLCIYEGAVEEHRYHETKIGEGKSKLVCELNLSRAQFVQMITSSGIGSGTPCTLAFTQAKGRIPEPAPEQTYTEVDKAVESAVKAARLVEQELAKLDATLREALRTEGVSGAKQQRILQAISAARRAAENTGFGATQIKAAGEIVVQAVKVEAESVLNTAAQQVGFARLEHLAEARHHDIAANAEATRKLLEGPSDV